MVAHPLTAAILISGRGSNMKRLIEAQRSYKIIGVASNKSSAQGLEVAKAAGIAVHAVDREQSTGRIAIEDQKAQLWDWIKKLKPDLVLLAGYMQIVGKAAIAAFPRRIINIHPALLPALAGLDTHARAIAEKHKVHGATVHLVDAGIDTGEIIAQASLQIKPCDDEHSLAARVLELEHKLYPWVIEMIANGNLTLEPKINFSELAKSSAKLNGFSLQVI